MVIPFPATLLNNVTQEACFNVLIIDDNSVEADEFFTLQLSTDDPQALLAGQGVATVSILDDDGEYIARK